VSDVATQTEDCGSVSLGNDDSLKLEGNRVKAETENDTIASPPGSCGEGADLKGQEGLLLPVKSILNSEFVKDNVEVWKKKGHGDYDIHAEQQNDANIINTVNSNQHGETATKPSSLPSVTGDPVVEESCLVSSIRDSSCVENQTTQVSTSKNSKVNVESSQSTNSTSDSINNATLKQNRPAVKRPYKCKVCGKAFSRGCRFDQHALIHTGVEPYKSQSYGKAFTSQGDLKVHERIHTDVKPYQCKTCGKEFNGQDTLKVHERIHTGAKSYQCKTCGKVFAQLGNLQIHERVHTGVRPYECTTCGKTFSQLGNLQAHERIHTGVKPYRCKTCGKTFVQLSSLKAHGSRHRSTNMRS